jgi:hypothetical protein
MLLSIFLFLLGQFFALSFFMGFFISCEALFLA